MTSSEAIEIIKVETSKITDYLIKEHKIGIRSVKEVGFGIKYEVKNETNEKVGILIIYYGKKGFKFVNEKVGCEESHSKVKEVFEDRDNLNNTLENNEIKEEKSYLNILYETLKPYANDEFDFTIFADELLVYSKDAEVKRKIVQNIYDFYELERIYKGIVKRG